MADNVTLNSGTGGAIAAADEVTYSGDTAQVQLTRLVHVSGAEGAKTVAEIVGTAGSPGTAVVTVQGVASGTVIPVSDGGGNLSIDDGGNTITVDGTVTANLAAGTNNIGDVDIASIAAGDNNIGNVDVASVPAPLSTTGGGTEAAALRVTIASDSTGVLSVDDNGGTLTVDGTVTANLAAGTNNIGDVDVLSIAAGDNNIGNVDIASAIPAGSNLIGRANLDPQTGNGLTIFRSIDLDETEEEVKATAGAVYAVWFSNLATSTRFLKFYNATAANVTVGTTTPVMTLALPGNTSDDISGVFSTTMGIAFGTAITVAATTGVADNDTGAPGANEVICNIFYA